MMTSSEEATVFRLMDNYSRNRHQSFVAEFDLTKDKAGYRVCFRPTGGTKDSPNRYACRYLHIEYAEAMEAAEKRELPPSVIKLLDKELPGLGQSA